MFSSATFFPGILLLAAATIDASVLDFSSHSKIGKRNNINKYYSCDSTQKSFINQAYKDTLTLADNLRPFLTVHDDLFSPVAEVGELEKRYFGNDIAATNDPKPALIRSKSTSPKKSYANVLTLAVINNIANWYAWPIFDWIGGKRIEVSCVDLPNTSNLQCTTKIGNQNQRIAAYALSENGAQIVFCELFFNHLHLAQVESNLQVIPGNQKDLTQMKSTAHVMFHEMTHLAVISNTDSGRRLSVWFITSSSADAYVHSCYKRLTFQSGARAGYFNIRT
jgi:hypothetical protein